MLYPDHKQSSGVIAVIVAHDRWCFAESLGVSVIATFRSMIAAKRLAALLAWRVLAK